MGDDKGQCGLSVEDYGMKIKTEVTEDTSQDKLKYGDIDAMMYTLHSEPLCTLIISVYK